MHTLKQKKHTQSCERLLVLDSQEVDVGGIKLKILLMYTLKQEKFIFFFKSLQEKTQNQAAANIPEWPSVCPLH